MNGYRSSREGASRYMECDGEVRELQQRGGAARAWEVINDTQAGAEF